MFEDLEIGEQFTLFFDRRTDDGEGSEIWVYRVSTGDCRGLLVYTPDQGDLPSLCKDAARAWQLINVAASMLCLATARPGRELRFEGYAIRQTEGDWLGYNCEPVDQIWKVDDSYFFTKSPEAQVHRAPDAFRSAVLEQVHFHRAEIFGEDVLIDECTYRATMLFRVESLIPEER